MEADSTTLTQKDDSEESSLPFPCLQENLMLLSTLTKNNGDGEKIQIHMIEVIERLQTHGLIPKHMQCPACENSRLVIRTARVVDRVQWVCEGCNKRQPIRTGSFFMRMQCSILQALQMVLAWCEDADCDAAAEYFGVKPRVGNVIFDKLDTMAARQQSGCRLGGAGSVVLTELYPDCLTRLSPDTTDQPHAHQVLMVADTKHVPTHYHLHVIKENLKKNTSLNSQRLQKEIEEVISRVVEPESIIVTGNNVPAIEGASTLQQLVQHCDVDMRHFLSTRIWRHALTLCSAARSLCGAAGAAGAGGAGGAQCAGAVQRYLHAALYRRARPHHFYRTTLDALAAEHTQLRHP